MLSAYQYSGVDRLAQVCIKSNGCSQEISMTLNSGHSLFKEHFPGSPTLPGALTLSMIIEFSRQYFDANNIVGFSLTDIERVSFIKRLHPSGNYNFSCNYKCDGENKIVHQVFVVSDSNNLNIDYARGVLAYKKIGY